MLGISLRLTVKGSPFAGYIDTIVGMDENWEYFEFCKIFFFLQEFWRLCNFIRDEKGSCSKCYIRFFWYLSLGRTLISLSKYDTFIVNDLVVILVHVVRWKLEIFRKIFCCSIILAIMYTIMYEVLLRLIWFIWEFFGCLIIRLRRN